jgi:hypothetical protein
MRIERIPVRFVADGVEGLGQLADASRAGLFVRSSELPRTGSAVAVQFRSPTGVLVDLRGEVRWTTQGLAPAAGSPGFGVQLHEPSREYREFVLWAVGQAKDDAPA